MARPLPSRGDIVRCLIGARGALHARQIAERVGVSEAAYPRLLELLDQLSFDGTLRKLPGRRFKAQARHDIQGTSWEGVLSVNPRGFGFVTAVGEPDLYVAPDGIGGALHGDRVRIQVLSRTARGVEGRIDAVVERRNPRVAGVLRRKGRSAWLEPDDTRMRGPIVILNDSRLGKDGEAAVVNITRFPSFADENPEGELVAVLGTPGDPNCEVAKILVREQIVEEHPDAAVKEAEAMAARVRHLPLDERVDLRHVPLPTIDPDDARDHDDAVWVERTATGYRVWVAIADVAEYVRPGSALDEEARARSFTIYLPDRAIPMLPTALASDLCSLLPEQDRLCMCVIAELDKQGSVTDFEVVEGVMRSAAMLTYSGVAGALGFSEKQPRSAQAEAFKRDLRVIDELSRKLKKTRSRRGALELDVPEARVLLDAETGTPVDVVRRAQDPGMRRAYSMVEELMLLANELVARFLSRKRCPAIYRVHGKPDEEKLERLAEVASRLGARLDPEELSDPRGVSKWLNQLQKHPKRGVLEQQLLRSLKQAAYDIVNIGHFGLASDNYLHFTSPIRRYPDVLVHRAVKRLLSGEKPDTSPHAVEELRNSATHASVRERAGMEVEREVVDLYRALLMQKRLGDVCEGTVSSVVGSGLYVTLQDPFVDVLVRFEALGPDQYEIDDDELSAVGRDSGDRIALGDPIVVVIEDVAVLRRTVYARRVPPAHLLEREGRGRRPKQRGTSQRPGKPKSGRGSGHVRRGTRKATRPHHEKRRKRRR